MDDFCARLFSDPLNGRVLQNVEKYEKLLVSLPSKSVRGDGLRRPTSKYLRTRDTYERLCQTQGTQVWMGQTEYMYKALEFSILVSRIIHPNIRTWRTLFSLFGYMCYLRAVKYFYLIQRSKKHILIVMKGQAICHRLTKRLNPNISLNVDEATSLSFVLSRPQRALIIFKVRFCFRVTSCGQGTILQFADEKKFFFLMRLIDSSCLS